MDDKTKSFETILADSMNALSDKEKKAMVENLEKAYKAGDQKGVDSFNSMLYKLNPMDREELMQQAAGINEKMKLAKGLQAYEEAQGKRAVKNIPSASTLKSVEEAAPILDELNIHAPDSPVAKEIGKMQKIGKFKRVLGALGSRATKALPYVGTGVGLLSAKEALAKGDKLGAALETASAFDPTPISDIALAAKDVYDIATEPSEQKSKEQKSASPEAVKNMVKVLGGEPDVSPKKASMMVGEKPSKDVSGENYSTYDNYIKQQKRKLGY
jgi:hypothetical protein